MKDVRWTLVTAILDTAAGICFMIAAALHTEMPQKGLCGVAAVCLLISGIGFFSVYIKKRKNSGRGSGL